MNLSYQVLIIIPYYRSILITNIISIITVSRARLNGRAPSSTSKFLDTTKDVGRVSHGPVRSGY